MNTSHRRSIAKRAIAMLVFGVAIGAMLGGCGGSGGGASSDASPSSTPTTAGSGMDAFIAEVARVLGMGSDTSEPEATDKINATAPDNTEPAPVS